jgi:hypothetical protein
VLLSWVHFWVQQAHNTALGSPFRWRHRLHTVIHRHACFFSRTIRCGVAADTGNVHTPTMTLKNAALLALIGTILTSALLLWKFVFTFLNVLRGLVPAAMLFSSFIYAFGCFSVAVFFYVFHKVH